MRSCSYCDRLFDEDIDGFSFCPYDGVELSTKTGFPSENSDNNGSQMLSRAYMKELATEIRNYRSRIECLQLSIDLAKSNVGPSGTSDIIRRAAGFYDYLSRGEKNE